MYSGCSLVAEGTALKTRGSQDAVNSNCSTKVRGSLLDSAPGKMSPECDFLSGCYVSCSACCTIVGRSRFLEDHEKRVFFDSSPGWHCHGPKNLEKAPSLSNLLISQRPPFSFIIKVLIENSQHLSHCSTTLWLFKRILGHHPPTKCSEPAGFTHLPSTSLVVSTLLQNFMFYVSFYVQNTFFRVMGNFVFLGIQRPDSSSSSSERRYGPVLWVMGYSRVTGSSWWTLATHLGWNKGVGEHLAGEVPIGTVLSKRKEAV